MRIGSLWAIALVAVGLGALLTRGPVEPVLASGGVPRDDDVAVLFAPDLLVLHGANLDLNSCSVLG